MSDIHTMKIIAGLLFAVGAILQVVSLRLVGTNIIFADTDGTPAFGDLEKDLKTVQRGVRLAIVATVLVTVGSFVALLPW
ncbi:MAG: hypothetical protein HOV78_20325 [Hamadaea sp.]|nr:hypothetical protein [Hamadaea sp.]NUO90628.1 hypothetical protein [Dermatophilaceae bacterium]